MKIKLSLALIVAILSAVPAWGQGWVVCSSFQSATCTNPGVDVGVATLKPQSALDVNGNVNLSGGLIGQLFADDSSATFVSGSSSNTRSGIALKDSWNGSNNNNGYVSIFVGNGIGNNEGMRVVNGGLVGIGTQTPCSSGTLPASCKLSVAGGIQAYEVVVSNNWSDYVFAPDYRLAPLSDVAAFVKENHHLPDMPSAAEVQENGVSLGDMQAKLLAKVEELTLHMIEAEERSQRLEQENQELQREAKAMRERIGRIERAGVAGGPK